MARTESYTVGLLPIVLAAGLFSGGYFRPSPGAEQPKTPEKAAEVAVADQATPSSLWLSDLEPVMEVMGDAMGIPVLRDMATRVASTRVSDHDVRSLQAVMRAVNDLRAGIGCRVENRSSGCEVPIDLDEPERLLSTYLLAEAGRDESHRTLPSTIAEAALNELEGWRALVDLTERAKESRAEEPRYEVDFIVATVPDYVDSNSGWLADQSLTAIQAAMSRADYLLDRFRLIDWTRIDSRTANTVMNNSRLHERQPGALIFRQVGKDVVRLQVVLLVLETPTSGVHRVALQNAIRFIRSWNRYVSTKPRRLLVLGPTFSGSALSMANTLGDKNDGFAGDFQSISVVSGSATADENLETFKSFAPNVEYSATVQPTSKIRNAMAAFLQGMNPSWNCGKGVAILRESNTAYGASKPKPESCNDDPFEQASVFTFPMHVSQLRSDSPVESVPSMSLLPTAAIPLNMKETTPAADQIPALRPQLTSPVVESTIATILDAMQHEHISAVGIQATDDRDILFLAREVKRAAPDVQLFLMGAHALYLHPDYVPYLRGTLVASSYSLSLTTEKDFLASRSQRTREAFQSMAAQGLFNATLFLMSQEKQRLDYCDPGQSSTTACAPPVSISVIGEDGFWPLPGDRQATTEGSPLRTVNGKSVRPLDLPPLPTSTGIIFILLAVFIIAQVFMLVSILKKLKRGDKAQMFLRWPVLRVLTPPSTYKSVAKFHRFALLICFCLLALLAAWTATIAMPFLISSDRLIISAEAALIAAAAVMVPAVLLTQHARRHPSPVPPGTEEARQGKNPLKWPTLLLLLASGIMFIGYLAGLLPSERDPAASNLTLARIVGGGIVSPAAVTICLFAALYTGIFSGMRRLSLVGYGYPSLEKGSRAFQLLTRSHPGDQEGDRGSRDPAGDSALLSDVLDMPTQNLPLSYICGISLGVALSAFSLLKVSTVDGWTFTWFLRAASATCLMIGLMSLAQGLAIWNSARPHLKRLAQSRIEGSFESIAHLVPWDLSLVPPRLIDLRPAAQKADEITSALLMLKRRVTPGSHEGSEDRVAANRTRMTDGDQLQLATTLPIRVADIAGTTIQEPDGSHISKLEREIEEQQFAFTQSDSWLRLWKVSNCIVELLEQTTWRRSVLTRRTEAPAAPSLPAVLRVDSMSQVDRAIAGISLKVPIAAVTETPRDAASNDREKPEGRVAEWVRNCEEFIALQFAFVLRDILARTLNALFTSMLCLTFLTAAHLLYSFNGRSSLLTVDLLAIAGAAVVSIWILVGIERETVISRLRKTTPGRLDLNWAFVQRVAIYGVLPLFTVIGSLFPEIGQPIFGWLEPLRKLASH